MTCKKCGSENIQLTNEVKLKRKRGVLYWMLVGWWMFLLFGIFMFIFGGGKKAKNITRYHCMNCGNNWTLKAIKSDNFSRNIDSEGGFENEIKKRASKKGWLIAVIIILVLGIIGTVFGRDLLDNEVGSEDENISTTSEAVVNETKEESEKPSNNYIGAYRFVGKAVQSYDALSIKLHENIELDDWTDYIVGKSGADMYGEELTPGSYEFQHIVFPEGEGTWYTYINEEIKIVGNPKSSEYNAGEIYQLKEGDIISVGNVCIVTFYKVNTSENEEASVEPENNTFYKDNDYSAIEERAKLDWVDDMDMREFVYETQVEAYEYLKSISTDLELIKKAVEDWPDDYIMQRWEYETQLEAKKFMEAVSDNDIRKKTITNEWPNDYMKQKTAYEN